jgi:putative PIN family toxin of toxin-antitoxin system
MRVFLDANVLVSAFATRGLCADVAREVLLRHRLILSARLLAELRKALRVKIGAPQTFIAEITSMLQQDADIASSTPLSDTHLRDKADIIILSGAVNGAADIFVTGDKELLELGHIGGMPIVSPRHFWEQLTIRKR